MNYLSTREKGLFALGVLLAIAGILLATSFSYVENHTWYWNTPHVLCIITLLLCAFGSFLIGHNLSKRRLIWVIMIGGVFIIAWGIIGLFSFILTFPSANYFSDYTYVSWDSYHGDYLVGWFHIISLVGAAFAGLIGGFLLGFGLCLSPCSGHSDVYMQKYDFRGQND